MIGTRAYIFYPKRWSCKRIVPVIQIPITPTCCLLTKTIIRWQNYLLDTSDLFISDAEKSIYFNYIINKYHDTKRSMNIKWMKTL